MLVTPRALQNVPIPRVASLWRQLLTLGLDLVAPVVVFYGLRWAGVGTLVALGAGAVIPGMGAAIKIARTREVDQLALVVMATMLGSIGVSFISGNARFLLAKDGVLTGVWGAWFLLSVRSSRPAAFTFSRPLLEGRKAFTAESWDSLWERLPAFRRIWRTASVMWGLGVSADAVLRVLMAYALPVDVAPALGGLLFPVTFVVLQVITNIYYHRAGLWAVLDAPWIRSRSPAGPP